MADARRTKIMTHLWYAKEAEEAAKLIDRFGVRWQIVPAVFETMMRDRDVTRTKRVTDAMLAMIKLDIAALERAYRGN